MSSITFSYTVEFPTERAAIFALDAYEATAEESQADGDYVGTTTRDGSRLTDEFTFATGTLSDKEILALIPVPNGLSGQLVAVEVFGLPKDLLKAVVVRLTEGRPVDRIAVLTEPGMVSVTYQRQPYSQPKVDKLATQVDYWVKYFG